MTRRIAALAAFVSVIVLALLLLWRVYVHHTKAEPYDDDRPIVVHMSGEHDRVVKFAAPFC